MNIRAHVSWPQKGWRLAWIFALLHLLLAGSFSVLNPLGESPDEADHWAYVVYLAQHRRLPEGPQITQSKHPPAYHAGAALFARLGEPDISFLRANPDLALEPAPTRAPNFFIHTAAQDWPWAPAPLAFHLARLWSVLLSTGLVLAAYGLTRAALPHHPGLALTVTGATAFWPEVAFLGGAVNNDTPVALCATLALWGGFRMARTPGPWTVRLRAGWWTPLALGLGLLTKLSAAAIWPIVGITLALGCLSPTLHLPLDPRAHLRALWSRRNCWLPLGFAVFGLALLLAAPWLWRNWQLYGDPTGVELARQTIDQRTTPWTWADTRWLFSGWFLSFWGKFGAVGHIAYPRWIYTVLLLLSAGGLVGLALSLISAMQAARRPDFDKLPPADPAPESPVSLFPLLLCMATVAAVALGIWRYSLIALGTDQGRLLFPALVPILILLTTGLRALVPRALHRAAAQTLLTTLAALTLYGLFGILRPAYAPLPPPAPAEIATAQAQPTQSAGLPVHFGELSLIAVELAPQPVLYWHAPQPPQTDWRTILRVVAPDGTLVWEWRRSPGYGRWSTDRWPADTTVRDAYIIDWPDWAGPGTYLLEVGLAPFQADPIIPQRDDASSPPLAHPYYFLGEIQRTE